jgi:hypothetical protein
MEETVGPVSTCRKELLRGWRWPIGLMVSFMMFKASVRNILDSTSCVFSYAFQTLLSLSGLHFDQIWRRDKKLTGTYLTFILTRPSLLRTVVTSLCIETVMALSR